MFFDYKALIVVLGIAAIVFAFAKPICRPYIDEATFVRRRNVWFTLVIAGFCSPSIWFYALVAMPVMFVAAKKDRNPLALYVLLLFAVPNVSIPIPTIAIGQLFELSPFRMMSLAILLPWLLRKNAANHPYGEGKLTGADWSLLAYCILQLALFVPYESFTNTMRRGLLLYLDTFVVFFAFSRLKPTRAALEDVLACMFLVCAVLAVTAVFESLRGWLLYQWIPNAWGSPNVFSWLFRGNSLRAQVSTGHSLVLGYIMCLGIGAWIYIHSNKENSRIGLLVTGVLCLGLLVSYSRGAWLSAILLYIAFLALRPGAASFFVKVLPFGVVLILAAYNSPLKELLIDRLPIIGSSDQETIDYRQRLAEVSWQLIKQNPIFGDPFVVNGLEDLRQGQGIIDIVNAYISVMLFSGFSGLILFSSTFLIVLYKSFLMMRRAADDRPLALLGAVLLASMTASLFFIGTAGVGMIEYLLAGLMIAYARIGTQQPAHSSAMAPSGLRGRGFAA